MIQPEKIPQFTGNLEQLETDYADLKKDAGHVRDAGGDIHSRFQGLSAFYHAPEAEQLFATTKPVKEKADAFADDLEKVSGALSSYATEIRPLVAKLKQLKADAAAFVSSVRDDDEWEYDEDKVDEHNKLRDDITATVAAFWAAERTCHNKITALWGGTQMVAGDGSDKKNQYGFNAEDMKNAKLPWGDPVEEKHKWYEVGHWVKSFVWDGLIVDGIWGTIKGLGTLVGFGGWEAMGQAWKGLAQLATGLAITAIPGAQAWFWTASDKDMPSWLRDSRTAMKETGKALMAWDEWGKNPARAAGAVTFNVLTTVFTGGAGAAASGAGKAGAVAKALSVAGKAGRVIDPMTYIAKGAGAGLSKIGDISKALKGVGNIDIPALPENAVTLPEGTVKLPDGTVQLPEGAALPDGATKLPDGNVRLPDDAPVLPEGTTKLPTEDGAPARYYDPDGNILDEHGNVLQKSADGPGDVVDQPHLPDTPAGPASGADTPRVDSPAQQPALVGAGTHTAEQAGQAGQHIRLGNSLDDGLGDVGRTGDDAAVPQARAGGDHLPGGRADDLAKGPSASHEPPSGHSSGDADAPGGKTHEHGSSGGHKESPTIGSVDDPQHAGGNGAGNSSEAGHVPPGGGHPDLSGSDHPGGRPIDDIASDRYSTGDHASHPPSEPMRPDQKEALTEALTRARMSQADQEKVLRTLGKEPYGADVAELISRGHLSGVKNYDEILNMCKQASKGEQKGMVPAAYMALSHATDLQSRGFTHLAFELKDGATGLDLDVTTLHADGSPHYGYQLKDVDNIGGIKGAAKSAGKQLLPEVTGAKKIAVLDVHQSMSELNAKMFREVEFQARRTGATYHLRFHDGSVTVPSNGHPLFP
ncbi:hypothetical protein [Streptomyces sp. Go-475]|uniref:hypothetical protein n=1 Tax=Streptomyces sp. Go-475 TaxID=2072505 RepID=UPI000DEED22F|nr:hypothetical protein [Streptomyces sp. Go-475]AXE89383.1 hypothetical protein C1703_30640 [Streptomyces sp. Go-475]